MNHSEVRLKKDRRTLLYYAAVPIRGTRRHKWVCTGERDYAAALEMVGTIGLDRLLHLHHAGAVTAEAVQLVTVGRVNTCLDVQAQWLEWFTPTHASNTVVCYDRMLRAFLKTAAPLRAPLSALSEESIRNWVNEPHCKLQTRMFRLKSVRSLFKFASARGYIVGNPSLLVGINTREMAVEQLETKHYQPIPEDGYQRLLAVSKGTPIHDWVVIAYCTGLRLTDCVGMEWASLREDSIMVFPLKARRHQVKRLAVPFSDPLVGRPEMLDLVARLKAMKAVQEREVAEDAFLKANPARQREYLRYIWPLDQMEYSNKFRANGVGIPGRLRAMFDAAGLQEFSFHCLRTTFARRLEESGLTMESIAARLTHSSVKTTAIYLAPINEPARFRVGMDFPAVRPCVVPAPAPDAVLAKPESAA